VPSLDPSTQRLLAARLAEEQRRHRMPSTSAGLVRRGEQVWAAARGTVDGRPGGLPATPDTQYRIGSIT
jgi:CubicO group peptidase (beta-lactamase class C family)